MSEYRFVKADHVSVTYKLNQRISVNQLPNGKWYCDLPNFGCSNDFDTPEQAIESLLKNNGCSNIVISSDITLDSKIEIVRLPHTHVWKYQAKDNESGIVGLGNTLEEVKLDICLKLGYDETQDFNFVIVQHYIETQDQLIQELNAVIATISETLESHESLITRQDETNKALLSRIAKLESQS